MKTDRYLSRAEAANRLGLSPNTLANLASKGKGPPFFKPNSPTGKGGKTLYDPDDLDRWVRASRPKP
mgnify:CR=1 FL=1